VNHHFEWCIASGESQMINRHILEHHIDLRLETNLVEIISDENGHVKVNLTDKGEQLNEIVYSRCFTKH
jgi:hypothetical protein